MPREVKLKSPSAIGGGELLPDITIKTSSNNSTTPTQSGELTVAGLNAAQYGHIKVNSKALSIENTSTSDSAGEFSASGIQAYIGGQVAVNAKTLNVKVDAKGNQWAYGISAQNNSEHVTDLSKIATVNIDAENITVNSTAEVEGHASGLVAMSQGIMNVKGNLFVNADDAIVTRGGSKVEINKDAEYSTKLNGNIDFNFDAKTSQTKVDSDVFVKLTGAESYWNGNATVSAETGSIPEGKDEVTGLNLILANGAQWNPTIVQETSDENSTMLGIAINSLEFDDGIINIQNGAKAKIDTISGKGGTAYFEVGDDFTGGTLKIKSGAENTTVTAKYSMNADEVATTENFQKLVKNTLQFSEDAQGVSAIAEIDEGLIMPGMKAITTNNINGNELAIQNIRQNTSTATIDGMRNIAALAIVAWRQEDSTLSQRLGQLRESQGDQGLWVRVSRGEFEYRGDYKNQYNFIQLGYDKAYGNWHYGLAVSHNDGETTYANGDGENPGFST